MTVAITLRLPDEMHEALRREAFEQRTSITAIIVGTLRHREEDRIPRTGCDVCNRPHVTVSTPGGFRFCEDHRPSVPSSGGAR